MATEASKTRTSTPTREPDRPAPAARKPAFTVRFGWGPAALAGVALLCLLAGLLVLAVQIKAIFSDQLKQEYTGLVLDAIGRAESARDLGYCGQYYRKKVEELSGLTKHHQRDFGRTCEA